MGGKGGENFGGIFLSPAPAFPKDPSPTPPHKGEGLGPPLVACHRAGISTGSIFEIGTAADAGLSPSPLWGGVGEGNFFEAGIEQLWEWMVKKAERIFLKDKLTGLGGRRTFAVLCSCVSCAGRATVR